MRLLILLGGLMSWIASAQVVWLNDDWHAVSDEQQASFYIKQPQVKHNEGWQTTIYYAGSDIPRFKGSFAQPGVYNKAVGAYEYFHRNGKLASDGSRNHKGEFDGLTRIYDEHGILSMEAHYVAGKRLGIQKRFYPNGELSSLETYGIKGREGLAYEYWDSGRVKAEFFYVNNQRQGQAKHWYQNGQLSWEAHYHQNHREGEGRFYDENGLLTRVENHRQNQKVGEQQMFYPRSSQLQELKRYDEQNRLVFEQQFTSDGSKTMEFSRRFVNGQPIQDQQYFKDGKLTSRMQKDIAREWSLYQEFDATGKAVQRKERLKGKLEGLVLESSPWEDFILHSDYHDGKRHGSYEKRLASGYVREQGEYANDKKVGSWLYQDGNRRRIEHYDNEGRLQGDLKETLLISDQVVRLEHYQQGKLEGAFEQYNEQGQLQGKGHYLNGARHGQWQYQQPDEERVMLWQGEYRQGTKIGVWQALSANGYELGREQYDANGLAQGSFYYFEESGLLTKVARYQDGQQHGDTVSYFSGKPYRRESFKQGEFLESIREIE